MENDKKLAGIYSERIEKKFLMSEDSAQELKRPKTDSPKRFRPIDTDRQQRSIELQMNLGVECFRCGWSGQVKNALRYLLPLPCFPNGMRQICPDCWRNFEELRETIAAEN